MVNNKKKIPHRQDLLWHHNSVIDSYKPHKKSTSCGTILSWCSSFPLQKPETNNLLFSKTYNGSVRVGFFF